MPPFLVFRFSGCAPDHESCHPGADDSSQSLSKGGYQRGRGLHEYSLHRGTKQGSERLPKDAGIGPKSGPRSSHSSPPFVMMAFKTENDRRHSLWTRYFSINNAHTVHFIQIFTRFLLPAGHRLTRDQANKFPVQTKFVF